MNVGGWSWEEVEMSWVEMDGAGWSWVELGGAGWSWVHGLVIRIYIYHVSYITYHIHHHMAMTFYLIKLCNHTSNILVKVLY